MKSQRATPEQRRDRAELDPRFGKIGISAVAAAMRYQSEIEESRLRTRQATCTGEYRRGGGGLRAARERQRPIRPVTISSVDADALAR